MFWKCCQWTDLRHTHSPPPKKNQKNHTEPIKKTFTKGFFFFFFSPFTGGCWKEKYKVCEQNYTVDKWGKKQLGYDNNSKPFQRKTIANPIIFIGPEVTKRIAQKLNDMRKCATYNISCS